MTADNALDSLLKEHKITFVRGDPMFSAETLKRNLIVEIYKTDHLKMRGRKVEKQINDVTESVQKTINIFGDALMRLVETEEKISDATKKVSGQLRDSTQKLSDGLVRIEKTANFDKLERYVSLLERAASAITVLSELEANGKLEKIAGSLR